MTNLTGMQLGLFTMAIDMINKAIAIDGPKFKSRRSAAVFKNGKRNGAQYYLCKNCGMGFVYNWQLLKRPPVY